MSKNMINKMIKIIHFIATVLAVVYIARLLVYNKDVFLSSSVIMPFIIAIVSGTIGLIMCMRYETTDSVKKALLIVLLLLIAVICIGVYSVKTLFVLSIREIIQIVLFIIVSYLTTDGK